MKSEEWKSRGSCASGKDPDRWFPTDQTSKDDIEDVKAICQSRCPVLDECRAAGVRRKEKFGIWGGQLRGLWVELAPERTND